MNKKRHWLEEFRKQAGLKQIQVAEQAEISKGYYSAIECGTRKTPGKQAYKISKVLGFPMEYFYREEVKDWAEKYERRKEIIKTNAKSG